MVVGIGVADGQVPGAGNSTSSRNAGPAGLRADCPIFEVFVKLGLAQSAGILKGRAQHRRVRRAIIVRPNDVLGTYIKNSTTFII